jgi:hypothetical protein
MKLADGTQIGYVITRDGTDGTVVPCAIFSHDRFDDAQDTVDAYNKKFEDDGITEYKFKLHMTAFYD